jgi:hypothetical protein
MHWKHGNAWEAWEALECMGSIGMHGKHWNAWEALECMGSIGMHGKHWNAWEALECIGSIGMHRKSTEADGADRDDGAGGEYKVSEAIKVVRTCQNLSEQNGTRLWLLLLHVGPNGDGFGGQAFMEHYTASASNRSPHSVNSVRPWSYYPLAPFLQSVMSIRMETD